MVYHLTLSLPAYFLSISCQPQPLFIIILPNGENIFTKFSWPLLLHVYLYIYTVLKLLCLCGERSACMLNNDRRHGKIGPNFTINNKR